MLSGEGNENGEKTTIGLISKKATFYLQHTFFCTFLCCCFARLQRKTSRNYLMVTRFMQEITYVFLFTFFFTAAHFHLGGHASSISHFLTAATKFSCCSSNKKCILCFLSLALALCHSQISRWASLACRLLSLFLYLYIPNLWTWQLIKA